MERKIFQAEVKEFDESDLTVQHFISTERRDRGGDVLLSDGMRTEGTPVVLLAHGFGSTGSEPIAKPLWIRPGVFKGRNGIMAKTQFFNDETGRRLWKKTTQGFMSNWSVGWRPIKTEMIHDRQTGEETRLVSEWELLEYSLVAVPMQPDAQTFGVGDQLSFKIMTEQLDLGPAYLVRVAGDLCVHLDDEWIKNVIQESARGAFLRARGRIPEFRERR